MKRVFVLAIAMLVIWAGDLVSLGQEPLLPPDHHTWGRFPVGAWRKVKRQVETLDERGNLVSRSQTEGRAKLTALHASTYTLSVDQTTYVGGQMLTKTDPQIQNGYGCEDCGASGKFKQLPEARLEINGRLVPCEVRQLSYNSNGLDKTTTVHYSPLVSPYQLKCETVVVNPSTKEETRTLTEILGVGLPLDVLGEQHFVSVQRTVRRNAQGTTTIVEHLSDDVPGGVIWQSTVEQDLQGRTTSRSNLELLEFGLETADGRATKLEPRRTLFNGPRSRRRDTPDNPRRP